MARQGLPSPSLPPKGSTTSRAADPARPEPLKPPPPIHELPILRLAKIPKREELGQVYGDESRLHTLWYWTKRIVVMTGLGAVVLFAALTWETWVPRTAQLGRMVATELDSLKQSKDQEERQRRALEDATARLPHLRPETIRLVLSKSSTGVLDPSEVFYVACEAADRGRTALTSREAQELKTLRAELLDMLRPSERERIREYDAARARRFPFSFENRSALELFARGAYALPPRSRERLRELFAKAVEAGLAAGVRS